MYDVRRTHPTFVKEASKFIDQAKSHALRENMRNIFCPCFDCKNQKLMRDTSEILGHIVERGFMGDYEVWTYHGEICAHEELNLSMDEAEDFIIEDMTHERMDEEDSTGIADMEPDFDLEDML